MKTVTFWNGNKSSERKAYELALLSLVLKNSSSDFSDAIIREDQTDYPNAADEGTVFSQGVDVCVTVAGNPKFKDGSYLPIFTPLLYGLLGHRLLIIRESDVFAFSQIKTAEQLQRKRIGIPATWADANLFRDNGYQVSEKGTLDDLFHRLKSGECDYVALGVNEINGIFEDFAQPIGGLLCEQTLRLYYPFALVFYVNPECEALAKSLQRGLDKMQKSGAMQQRFDDAYAQTILGANLTSRTEIALNNNALPKALSTSLQNCKKTLLR